jgi:hypothetical protein
MLFVIYKYARFILCRCKPKKLLYLEKLQIHANCITATDLVRMDG